jgi:DNA helicase-2/ATP-dependent DNA helicase PcrA
MLSYARSRFRNGQTQPSAPSIFLRDIDPALLQKDAALSMSEKVNERSANWGAAHRGNYGAGASSSYGAASSSPSSNTGAQRSGYGSSRSTPSNAGVRSFGNTMGASRLKPMTSGGAAGAGQVPAGLHVGSRVHHPKFGIGDVVEIEQGDSGACAIVQFEGESTPRKLLLKFAKFEIIG